MNSRAWKSLIIASRYPLSYVLGVSRYYLDKLIQREVLFPRVLRYLLQHLSKANRERIAILAAWQGLADAVQGPLTSPH